MRSHHPLVDVRRLAAVDMHALSGTDRRRRIIIAEFVLGAIGGIGIGLFLLLSGAGTFGTVLGLWAVGVGINYVPLALHAISLRSPRRLRAELRGVDLRSELRYYTRAQFWVFVPLTFVWFALKKPA
jgi:hypothetical protein